MSGHDVEFIYREVMGLSDHRIRANRSKRIVALRVKRSGVIEKLKPLLLSGHTNNTKLGAMFHLHPVTIRNYRNLIEQGWQDEQTSTELKYKRNYRINQLAYSVQKSLNSFEISMQREVETTTVSKQEKCEACKGTGIKKGTEDEWCEVCDGESTLKLEVVTQKQLGKAGDVAFLESARKGVVEIAKLEGLYVEKKSKGDPPPGGNHLHLHNENNPFAGASPDAIVAAMSAMERLKRESQQKTIDVDGYNEEEEKKS